MRGVKVQRLRHGGGNGGQRKNKVETAVRVTHEPTGIVVTSSSGSSQQENLREAMRRLAGQLEQRKEAAASEKARRRWEDSPDGGFGSDKVRTYYFHKQMVARDHRTGVEVEVTAAVDGCIDDFLVASLEQLV